MDAMFWEDAKRRVTRQAVAILRALTSHQRGEDGDKAVEMPSSLTPL